MKQLFKKISAMLMALIVLLSTLSFSFSEHFCGDLLVDSALFSKAESCGMNIQNALPGSDCSVKKDCCKDEVKTFVGQDDLKIDFSSLSFDQQNFIALYAFTYLNLYEGIDTEVIPFKYYSPPLVDKDISILYQVFRI
ncbi:hypothetical protein [Lutibacter sp.]|uniref:HYC_CC_PP family protein n=1 Tax=Lutibacter sp. TaxID=1925666 RepID=UPI0027376508|nr:hypothetical protein [Lutibacter sp.]MDP3312023.1 hypothetical protein [Lutibacter sp.]